MPVRVIKRKEKWRLIEPDGKIAKTPKGTARDGGGHTDVAKAKSQARAITRSLQGSREHGVLRTRRKG